MVSLNLGTLGRKKGTYSKKIKRMLDLNKFNMRYSILKYDHFYVAPKHTPIQKPVNKKFL